MSAIEPITESRDSLLEQALEREQPRFFRVSSNGVKGKTGREDAERFAEDLALMQECSQAIGECLEMSTIAYTVIYDGDNSMAYRYDPASSPRDPALIGALVNRRMSMRELLNQLADF